MAKQYKLPYTLRAPSEETEDMYLAEVPVLPGCRAWGATAEEALFNLEGVTADYIASCEAHGDALPGNRARARPATADSKTQSAPIYKARASNLMAYALLPQKPHHPQARP